MPLQAQIINRIYQHYTRRILPLEVTTNRTEKAFPRQYEKSSFWLDIAQAIGRQIVQLCVSKGREKEYHNAIDSPLVCLESLCDGVESDATAFFPSNHAPFYVHILSQR